MLISPRYEGPVIISIDGPTDDQREPISRQRRRMETLLAELTHDQWNTPSRCDGWSVRDVVAHLVSVNSFWHISAQSGLAGSPTKFLAGFDPASTPPQLVNGMAALSCVEVLDQFVATNDSLLGVLDGLDDRGWQALAETPSGHVPIRVLAHHALWDSWVHERDIALPLGLTPTEEPDEIESCLRFAAAVGPALAMGMGGTPSGTYAVEASDPEFSFVLDVGDSAAVRKGGADGVPCLRGSAVELLEALSVRTPLPTSAPAEWSKLLTGLTTAFATTPA